MCVCVCDVCVCVCVCDVSVSVCFAAGLDHRMLRNRLICVRSAHSALQVHLIVPCTHVYSLHVHDVYERRQELTTCIPTQWQLHVHVHVHCTLYIHVCIIICLIAAQNFVIDYYEK